jgi:hypothetical protein
VPTHGDAWGNFGSEPVWVQAGGLAGTGAMEGIVAQLASALQNVTSRLDAVEHVLKLQASKVRCGWEACALGGGVVEWLWGAP